MCVETRVYVYIDKNIQTYTDRDKCVYVHI